MCSSDLEDIIRVISEISSRIFIEDEDTVIRAPQMCLNDEVKEAHQEWMKAQKYFECVTDPELVDHAIFSEEAARRKYIYLLKKAKSQA